MSNKQNVTVTQSETLFADNFQLICALINHLGVHERFDTRSVDDIAGSIKQPRDKILNVLVNFPCFFRESINEKDQREIVLDDDLCELFPNSEAVNQALRQYGQGSLTNNTQKHQQTESDRNGKKDWKRRFAIHARYVRRPTKNTPAPPMKPEEIGTLVNVAMQMVDFEKQEKRFKTQSKLQQYTALIALIAALASVIGIFVQKSPSTPHGACEMRDNP
jgi:hypothetical protein